VTKYDVIIIGGGISGLGVAALLSKKGYKAILLEEEPRTGGRSMSFPYRGYVVDVGNHQLASYSTSGIGKIISEVGAHLELKTVKPSLMHYDLDTRKYTRATSRERFGDTVYNDFKALIKAVTSLSKEDINTYHAASAEGWILENFNNDKGLVEFFKKITGFAGQPLEKVSAGAFLETLHDAFTSEATISYPAHNGIQAFSDALEKSIRENGGEVITEIDVKEVKFDGNKVRGISAQKRHPSLIADVEIDAPLVVSTIPLFSLSTLVSKEKIGKELLDKIERIKAENFYYCGFIFGVKASLFDGFTEQFFQWTIERPGMDWHVLMTIPTYMDPELAPKGYHLVFADSHAPLPYGDSSKVKQRQGELLAVLKEVWPNFEDNIDWLHPTLYPNILPLSQKSLTGPYCPGFVVPGLKGLYLAGDSTYLSGSGIGSSIKSAFGCVAQIEKDNLLGNG